MKKKLTLNELNVQSFITTKEENLHGGAAIPPPTYGCSLHDSCKTLPLDQCATTDNACPTLHVACPTDPIVGCINIHVQATIVCVPQTLNCNTKYCPPPVL